MGPKYKEYGGGNAQGLGNDWIQFLQSGLKGNFGVGSGMDQTLGAAGVLNDILSGGAGKMGGSIGDLIHRDIERQRGDLHSRYSAFGGSGYGTPAANAESLFSAEAAPRAGMAIGNLQLDTLKSILPLIASTAGRGITQRQGVFEPSGWEKALQYIAPIAATALAPSTGGASLALASAGGKGKDMPKLTAGSDLGGFGGYSGGGGGSYTGNPIAGTGAGGFDMNQILRLLQSYNMGRN